MQSVSFVDLVTQYKGIADEVNREIQEVLLRGDFILGKAVAEFEAEYAEFVQTKHAVAVASGLDALRLSLLALGIGPGHEVILPANTFIATALAVSEVGALPVLVDCNRHTFNLDVNLIERAITPRTRAIIPVHLTGQAADMDPLLAIARSRSLLLVEDACQAHGAVYKGRPCGSMGATGCFSFYPGKNLGAYGDGGMITTQDSELANRLAQLRNCGQRVKYEHVVKGSNSRLDTIQAAVLRIKLRHLPEWNAARARHAAHYRQLLQGIGDVWLQAVPDFTTHVYHLFIIRTARRNELQVFLTAKGIQTGIHYPIPIHLQKAYAELKLGAGAFPEAESMAAEALSLPMYPEMTQDMVDYVAASIKEFFRV